MRVKVTLYVGGRVFDEVVKARDYQDAKQTAAVRNPTSIVVRQLLSSMNDKVTKEKQARNS